MHLLLPLLKQNTSIDLTRVESAITAPPIRAIGLGQ